MSIADADNTIVCGASTPLCVEQTQEVVELVLDSRRRRRYRQNMTKKPIGPLKGIRPEHLREALARSRFSDYGGKGHTALARHIDSYQQGVRRVLEGESEESGIKWPIVQALHSELWDYAMEKKILPLLNNLRELGLKPKDDNAMTKADVGLAGAASEYNFDLYEPWLARGDATMSFSARATAKILPPSYAHSQQAYAFVMKAENMIPRFMPGDICEVDPAVEPEIGSHCLFCSPNRLHRHVGQLMGQGPDHWELLQFERRGDMYTSRIERFSKAEWPTCEKIISVRFLK